MNVFHIEADCRSWPVGCQLDFESAGLRRFVGEAPLGECTQQAERFKLELNDTCLAITQGCGDGLLEVEYLRQMRNAQVETLQMACECVGLKRGVHASKPVSAPVTMSFPGLKRRGVKIDHIDPRRCCWKRCLAIAPLG